MNNKVIPFKKNSLFFAPMEGITDYTYRKTILSLYPEWDFVSTDFLRIPTIGVYPEKHILSHYGHEAYTDPAIRSKTIYQILTSETAYTKEVVSNIFDLDFPWLDINLGCPSKTVCKNKGGSYLLSDLKVLREIIRTIRENFKRTFTAKIRVGYEDDSNFEKIIELLNEEKVDAITIHARTRVELYKGVANWEYVKKAASFSEVPIIGNGDIWTLEDIERYYDFTGCHSIMLARSALKSPWMAKSWSEGKRSETLEERIFHLQEYFKKYWDNLTLDEREESGKVKRLKAISRYIFEGLPDEAQIKRKFLLSHDPNEMFDVINSLKA